MGLPTATRIHRFWPQALDPITVYVEEYRPGASRIVVQCYAQAWTAYWGSHGQCPVEEYINSCHPEYIDDNLVWGQNSLMLKSREKDQRRYRIRIIQAMQEHFKKEGYK